MPSLKINDVPGLLEVSSKQLADDKIARYAGADYEGLVVSTEAVINEGNQEFIFPNPAQGTVKINMDGIYQLNITDVTGKTIKTWEEIGKHSTVSTSFLPKGMYIVTAKSAGIIVTQKLLVK